MGDATLIEADCLLNGSKTCVELPILLRVNITRSGWKNVWPLGIGLGRSNIRSPWLAALEVAPVFLKTPQRIEAMMFLYFVALMLVSLIERRIRMEMQNRRIDSLPMRPAGMHTKKPTWRTIIDSFHGVHLATIEQSGKMIHTALKGLSALRQRILELLKVPNTIYTRLHDKYSKWEQNQLECPIISFLGNGNTKLYLL